MGFPVWFLSRLLPLRKFYLATVTAGSIIGDIYLKLFYRPVLCRAALWGFTLLKAIFKYIYFERSSLKIGLSPFFLVSLLHRLLTMTAAVIMQVKEAPLWHWISPTTCTKLEQESGIRGDGWMSRLCTHTCRIGLRCNQPGFPAAPTAPQHTSSERHG